MSPLTDADHERRIELLCDRALVGLSADGRAELDALLAQAGGHDPIDLDLAAAALDLALGERQFAPLPAQLATTIAVQAGVLDPRSAPGSAGAMRAGNAIPIGAVNTIPIDAARTIPIRPAGAAPSGSPDTISVSPTRVIPIRPASRPGPDLARWVPWLAAAACLLLAVTGWWTRLTGLQESIAGRADPAATEQRQQLLAKGEGVVRVDWTSTQDPASQGVSGDVVWSAAEQRGFMRLRGLAVNDPGKLQYQLWIFDKAQDERFPVDGGVFDIDRETGDVIVPITARLKVVEPTLFAVTIEKPGGVVVSKRDRIVVTAAVTPT